MKDLLSWRFAEGSGVIISESFLEFINQRYLIPISYLIVTPSLRICSLTTGSAPLTATTQNMPELSSYQADAPAAPSAAARDPVKVKLIYHHTKHLLRKRDRQEKRIQY
jgi:hypothetical protein